MTSAQKFTIRHAVMAFIVFLGVSIRVFRLGELPLSDFEAGAALDAFGFLSGNSAAGSGVAPGYSALTSLIFFIFGTSDFAARFLPALAGGLLAGVPLIFHRRLGTVPALAIAAGLAFDPVLTGVSRLAGGPAMGLSLALLAVAVWSVPLAGVSDGARKSIAGVLAGLAVISGPAVYLGILGLLFSWATLRALDLLPVGDDTKGFAGSRTEVVSFLLTILFAVTLFLRFPQGLASFATSLATFLAGWTSQSGAPVKLVFAALIGYQAVPFLFALFHIWHSWRHGSAPGKFLSIWFLSSLLLLLIYPGREVYQIIWVLVPLWGLAGLEIGRLPIWHKGELYQPLTLSSAIFLLTVSFWTNLASFSYLSDGDPQIRLRLLIMGGTFLLMVLSVALVALGWSPKAALAGTIWGILAAVLFGMIAGTWGTSHRSSTGLREIWSPGGQAGDVHLARATLERLGSWNGMGAVSLEIVDQTLSPAMTWALRGLAVSDTLAPLSADSLPDVILTAGPDRLDRRLVQAYRGEGFSWSVEVNWDQMSAQDWLRWWLFKEAPVFRSEIVLWARADLFLSAPDDQAQLFPFAAPDEPDTEEVVPLIDVDEIYPDN